MSLTLLLTRLSSRISDLYQAHVFRRKIERALALHQRGEARSDGLQLTSAKVVLHIKWLARAIHPWDRDLPPTRAQQLFAQQCLNDVDAAITRLFAEIPVLDMIEICVRREVSRPPLLQGNVRRNDLNGPSYQSI